MISNEAIAARQDIHKVDDADLPELVIRKYNCKSVERSCLGGIWIADPMTGHWLSEDDLIEFADWLKKQ